VTLDRAEDGRHPRRRLRAVLAVASICALVWADHARHGDLPPPRLPGTAGAAVHLAAPASSPPQVVPPPSWQVKPRPPGVATVVTGGRAWTTERYGDYLGLAQAGSDANRPFWGYGTPGLQSLISPDGRRLVEGGSIVDLTSSPQGQFWGQEDSDESQTPQAWSPDGRYVALLANLDRTVVVVDGGPGDRILRLLDTRTGQVGRDLAAVHWPQWPTLGWAVAFSPDSRRLAYQDGPRIRIIELDGDPVTEVAIPAGSRLAGKGAWTRDGTGLLVVSGERCACGGYPARWTVRTVSIATGELSGPGYQVDGAYAVRVLGWWRSSGRPVVAEYRPTAGTAVTFFTAPGDEDTLVAMRDVASVRLLRLSPGAPPDVLMRAAAQSMDVADDLINPTPPGGRPLRNRHLAAALAGALLLAALGIEAAFSATKARKRRRSRTTAP
jgi:hypothetical protein